MKKRTSWLLSSIIALFWLALTASAQTVTVNGTLLNMGPTGGLAGSNNDFVIFRLKGWQGNLPRVSGVGTIDPLYYQVTPNGSGVFSTTLYGNDQIIPSGTYYVYEQWHNGKIQSSASYQFCTNNTCSQGSVNNCSGGGGCNVSTQTPLVTQPPNYFAQVIYGNPTGSQSWTQLPGTSATFFGTFDFTGATLLTNAFVTSVFGRTGAVTAQAGDYTCLLVTNCPPINANNTWTGTNTFGTVSTTFTPAPLDNSNAIPNTAFFNQANAIPPATVNFGGVNTQCWIKSAGIWQPGGCGGTTSGSVLAAVNDTQTSVNANTTAEQPLQSFAFGAGVLNTLHKTLHIRGADRITVSTTSENVFYRVEANTNSLLAVFSFTPTTTGAGCCFLSYDIFCTVTTTGATGSFTCGGTGLIQLNTGTGNTLSVVNLAVPTANLDLTGIVTMRESVAFTVGSTSNVGTSYLFPIWTDN